MSPKETIWTFQYIKRPRPAETGQVGATSEAKASLVAETWCRKNGVRYLGTVKPFLLADESWLPVEPELAPALEAPQPSRASFGERVMAKLQ